MIERHENFTLVGGLPVDLVQSSGRKCAITAPGEEMPLSVSLQDNDSNSPVMSAKHAAARSLPAGICLLVSDTLSTTSRPL